MKKAARLTERLVVSAAGQARALRDTIASP
jgi:hypothetical protein